jgi:hypothetical protein
MALDHTSPVHGAADLWKRPPKDYELPAIRSAFDITWAFWDRATVGGNIQNLKYFHDCLVVNPDPLDLIRQAHEKLTPPRSAPGTWPGTEFSMYSEQGLALPGESSERLDWVFREAFLTVRRVSAWKIAWRLPDPAQGEAW